MTINEIPVQLRTSLEKCKALPPTERCKIAKFLSSARLSQVQQGEITTDFMLQELSTLEDSLAKIAQDLLAISLITGNLSAYL